MAESSPEADEPTGKDASPVNASPPQNFSREGEASDPGYPLEWETHAILADGSAIELRPIRSTDRDALHTFHQRQSKESIYFRFFRHRPHLSDSELDFFTQVDYSDRMAFVAMLGSTLVAVARYERLSNRSEAEVAFFVDDDHHGRGIATLMLEYLAAAARQQEIERFSASVLSENYRMLAVFRKAGFEVKSRFSDGHIAVDMDIAVTEKASSVIADRERQSRIRSVTSIVSPSGIVVVGASRHPGSIGYELFINLIGRGNESGFPGPVVAVNKSTNLVAGQPAFATVADAVRTAARVIDLAVIAVPAVEIPEVIAQCADSGIKSVFVVSSGFAEAGPAGQQRQQELVDLVRSLGLRLVGPNAFGMVNTSPDSQLPDSQLKALYIDQEVSRGPVGLVSQSGPLGVALLQQLATLRVGISTFVGVGNRADVSVNDLLDYWSADDATKAVVMYVENYGNLRNFASAANHLTQTKSLLAISPAEPERRDLLSSAGVMLVDSVSQLASQAKVAVSQPVAQGNRVAIVSNTSSLARLAFETCRANDLEVVVPASSHQTPSQDAVLIGDVDTVALRPSSEPDDYEKVVVATAVSADVDMVLIAIAPTPYLDEEALASLLDRVNRSIDKPIVAVGLVGSDSVTSGDLPYFTYPEEAAKALAVHARHGLWRAKSMPSDGEATTAQEAEITDPDQLVLLVERLLPPVADGAPDSTRPAAKQPDKQLENDTGAKERIYTLANPEMADVLSHVHFPVADYGVGSDVDSLVHTANRIGYPVVLKANIDHRSVGEVGGAAIDLHDETALAAAHARMSEAFGESMSATVVQRMIPSTDLARIELIQDPELGSQIEIGWGRTGAQRKVSIDRCYLPLRPGDAAGLAEQLLEQILGASTDDASANSNADGPNPSEELNRTSARQALIRTINQLGAVAKLTPAIAMLRLDPILLSPTDAVIADVELVVRRSSTSPLNEVRHL